MAEKRTEACGRCSMTTVIDAIDGDKTDDERAARDPFGTARIEVDETELSRVTPSVWLSGVTTRLNDAVQRLTYGR